MHSCANATFIQIKAMGIGESPLAVLSRALDPPPASTIADAVTALTRLGALDSDSELTPLVSSGHTCVAMCYHVLYVMLCCTVVYTSNVHI
jgi:HrpA-like RNA helicase